MIEVVIYIIFCALTALFGSHRRMGFIGTFVLTLLTTPLIMIPVLVLTGQSSKAQWPQS